MARHKSNSRITPKGTVRTTDGVSRDAPQVDGPSPTWVAAVMFGLMGIGVVMILVNYTVSILGMPSNWYLLSGLGLILAGIIAATQYR